MSAAFVVVLALLSRFLPGLLHVPAWGATALHGGLLYSASRVHGRQRWFFTALAVVGIACTDWILTAFAYGYPFHPGAYALTWIWYTALFLSASSWLYRRSTWTRVAAAAVAAPTGFFLFSNGEVWLTGLMYPRTVVGLLDCYAAGLPFYRNGLISTVACCAFFFGMPVLARQISTNIQAVQRKPSEL